MKAPPISVAISAAENGPRPPSSRSAWRATPMMSSNQPMRPVRTTLATIGSDQLAAISSCRTRMLYLRRRRTGLAAGQRDQHRDLLAIATILVAEQGDHVALLEPDADQDIAGGPDREQQVAGRHGGRRPEGQQEAEIERMARTLVE